LFTYHTWHKKKGNDGKRGRRGSVSGEKKRYQKTNNAIERCGDKKKRGKRGKEPKKES